MSRRLDKVLGAFDSGTVFLVFTLAIACLTIIPIDLGFLNTFWGRILSFAFAIVLAKKDVRLALIWVIAYIVVMFKHQHVSTQLVMRPVTQIPGYPLPHPQELDLEKDFPVQQTPDGVLYQTTDETEVGRPLHPDLYHSGPQSLGDPLPGYEPESNSASF